MTTVLTAIIGGYDALHEAPQSSKARFICYTDDPRLKSKSWQIRLISDPERNPRKLARRIKALAHEYVTDDVILWVDARFQITRDPAPLIERALTGTDIALHGHPSRTTVSSEGEECRRLRLADPKTIAAQVRSVIRRGANSPLYATGILARRMTPRIKKFGRQWWREIEARTLRDQLSITVSLRELGIQPGRLPGPSIWNTPGFSIMPHLKKRTSRPVHVPTLAARVARPSRSLYRWDIINSFLRRSPEKRFLEIGVGDGSCAARVHAKTHWGVDPSPRAGAETYYDFLFRGTSDQFFRKHSEKFDVVLVDGLHHAAQVYRDIMSALAVVGPNGVVIAHDCNPSSRAMQAVPQEQGIWTGDCWRAIVRLRATRTDVTTYVLDTDYGVGVVRKIPSTPITLEKSLGELTFHDLAQNRRKLLGLTAPK